MNREKVGRRIFIWLMNADMTQNDLAVRLSVSPAKVRDWICGTCSISFDHAEQICSLFGKTLDELAGRKSI
ncbi:helix-turn-helix domain protein [Coriobacterium glomerans PW2]|uniref:Helix-turn-helix domain protein n=1 Tax=Coriobacterium glomerans (strain ATCC 49209 / DSM 20642 / JCM 10262 / PW2) TaxID=700015 RepID=F2N8F4_CORGP|nr:helix-turn-helix domain protein [Coriobacterium glomerans PW2]